MTKQLIKHPRKYELTPIKGVSFPFTKATFAELHEYCNKVLHERIRDIEGLTKYLTSIGVIIRIA